MAKFMCTHTMSGVTQEMYAGVAAAGQKEPNIKLLQSFANLTEGKIYCVWQSPNPDEVTAWFKKMNVPYDSITKVEVEADGGSVKTV